MRPQIPHAPCVDFVLMCCSCWRLTCCLCVLAGLLLAFYLFLLGPLFFFWGWRRRVLAAETGVKEYLEHFHPTYTPSDLPAGVPIEALVATQKSCVQDCKSVAQFLERISSQEQMERSDRRPRLENSFRGAEEANSPKHKDYNVLLEAHGYVSGWSDAGMLRGTGLSAMLLVRADDDMLRGDATGHWRYPQDPRMSVSYNP